MNEYVDKDADKANEIEAAKAYDKNVDSVKIENKKKKILPQFDLNFLQEKLSYVLFLTFFILIYISNGHRAINIVRQINKLVKENKELRYEYLMYKNELSKIIEQEKLIKEMNKLGLKELKSTPLILIDSSDTY